MDEKILKNFIESKLKGKRNAKTIFDISHSLHVTDRTIRETIKKLNYSGYPIATSVRAPYRGVYWCETSGEMDEYLSNLKARAVSIFNRMAVLDKVKTREFLKRQLTLFKLGE